MKLNEINIEIEKTGRKKTVSIFIERDGTVKVLAPLSASEEKIEEILKSKEYQIYSKLAKWKELNQGKVKREYVNGQSFLYCGRNYRLMIADNQDVPLKISGGYFHLDSRYRKKAETVFKDFYKLKSEQKILERIILLEEKVEKKPVSVRVMELRNRWASCTPKNGLNFNWKCIMAPVSVIDYIIAHELVHLKYKNHSKEFWNELDKLLPSFRESEEWLKRNGVKMTI
jgi:predicted metal-dependent hydrolase